MTDKPSINDCINEFYKLKDSYEQGYKDKYIIPIIKSAKSFKEKRVDYSRLPKQECVNCKRNVGTIFSITYVVEELSRRFIVKCGDLKDPCPLDIQLMYSERTQLDYETNECMDEMKQLKFNIIKHKNNSLFFLNETQRTTSNNVIAIFEKLNDELKRESTYCGALLESKMLITYNPAKNDLLKRNNDEFGRGLLLPFKSMIHDYMDSKNETIIHNAVEFYVNEMIPKLKRIQDLKYQVNFVEEDATSGKYVLFQNRNSIQSTESFTASDDVVISFVKGIQKTNNKTMKLPSAQEIVKSKTKSKTKKIKKTMVLLEEEPIVAEEVAVDEPIVAEEVAVDEPIVAEEVAVEEL